MYSTCPKCGRVVEDDIICCAELTQTWKCKSCGKLTTGFVVPYGRCFLCSGELEVIEAYSSDDPAKLEEGSFFDSAAGADRLRTSAAQLIHRRSTFAVTEYPQRLDDDA